MKSIRTVLRGCRTLWMLVTFRPASSTPGASRMSDPTNSPDTRSATSSPGSPAGRLPCDSPDGRKIDRSGPDHAPASLSARQAKAMGLLTSGIYGPLGSTSSRSADLQSSLESRLRRRLTGSALWLVTWKAWVTPWGACLSRPRASARSISATACGSLPTPSGTSNHGKNHVSGRLDEWGGSSNPFRGTPTGKVHCAPFELWAMGYSDAWMRQMPPATRSSRKPRKPSSSPIAKPEG